MLSADPDAALERLRKVCLGLPQTDEVISHGIPAFRVAGKMFAYFRHNHHGVGRTEVCLKTAGRDEQDMLLEADPEVFSRPAYLWPSGWVGMSLAGDIDWAHVEGRVLTSWRLAAPKRLAAI